MRTNCMNLYDDMQVDRVINRIEGGICSSLHWRKSLLSDIRTVNALYIGSLVVLAI